MVSDPSVAWHHNYNELKTKWLCVGSVSVPILKVRFKERMLTGAKRQFSRVGNMKMELATSEKHDFFLRQ